MTLRIYTAPIDYRGDDRLDISRKSGEGIGLLLAPSRELLQRYHPRWGGKPDWPAYRNDYTNELMDRDLIPLMALTKRESVTLVCYCKSRSRCHRILAADFLVGFLLLRPSDYIGERGKRGILPPIERIEFAPGGGET